jgi:hypothetical protein
MSVPVNFRPGLSKLVDDVRAYFKVMNCTASVRIGFRERRKQDNQGVGGANRVVFTPCDDNGDGGELSLEHLKPGLRDITNGASPPVVVARFRELFTYHRIVVVSVWAHDDSKADDEERQIAAVDNLRDLVVQGIKQSQAGAANAFWKKTQWTYGPTIPVELRNGVEWRGWLELREPIPDRPIEVAYPAPVLDTVPAKGP